MSALLTFLLVASAMADTPVDSLPEPAREQFGAAEAAWSKGELEAAEVAFGEVIAQSPTFDRAYRRRCGVRLELARVDEALTDCEKAVTLVEGFENRTALAIAMLHDHRPKEARELIDAVLRDQPEYLPAQVARCVWASQVGDRAALQGCSGELAEASPGSAGSLYFRSLAALQAKDVAGARAALIAAREKGLSDDLVLEVSQHIQLLAEAERNAPKKREAAEEAAWTVQDLVPLLVVSGLLLTLAVLWFGREDKGRTDTEAR
jgi:tetratricopeptide (TPR) repeat protein